ncbi:hypothetical protein BC829DRAFT_391327 [Chytridium lagenaria]|nr:hypothetical protein BC829DRAFT_391327 [Chytridium lagenaria]
MQQASQGLNATPHKRSSLINSLQKEALTEFKSSWMPVNEETSTDTIDTCIAVAAEETKKPFSTTRYHPTTKKEALRMDTKDDAASSTTDRTVDATSQQVDRILSLLKDANEEVKEQKPSHTVSTPISSESSAAVFDTVKSKITSQQLEIEEKSSTILALRSELKKSREALTETDTQLKKEMKSKLSNQKKEYENAIKRHLGFIDKLMGEKEELTKRCETLGDEVKGWRRGLRERTLEEHHARDLKQQREMWMAAEKVKRDKWITERTKAIKEQTVKGLEPEIQRMIAQHKIQIRQMEERVREESAREKSVLVEAHERQMSQMRDRLTSERQKAAEEERETSRLRYQKQFERDEMEFQAMKRKMMSEFEARRRGLGRSFEGNGRGMRRRDVGRWRRGDEGEDGEMKGRWEREVKEVREKGRMEREEWMGRMVEKFEAEMRQRDKVLREKLLKERDAELEMIVERLEAETNSSASDISHRYRAEIERLKSEFADEVKQLKDQHNLALDKVISAQATLSQSEDQKRDLQKQLLKLKNEIEAKEMTVKSQRSDLARLQVDEATLQRTIRHEFEDQMREKDIELRKLHLEVELVKRESQSSLDAAIREKESSLQFVEERVRVALSSKEEQCRK